MVVDDIVYLNGRLISRSEARLSPLDYGFLYGYGLFETMRAYRGRVFCLQLHLERLARSAPLLGISLGTLDLAAAVMDTLRANQLSEARLRLAVTIGAGGLNADPGTCKQPTVLVLAGPYTAYPQSVYRRGFRAVMSTIRRNSQSPLSRLKSANYIESILAKQEARAAGVDEALCRNERGQLAEASMSNLFLVAGGRLLTPGPESGILPGITREVVLELAAGVGIATAECTLEVDDLGQAEEALVTSSLLEVMPLTEVDGRPIGSGRPGPVTRKLMAAYRRLVKAETA